MHGTLDRLVVESELLADNPLGDPARRPLYVYRPPGVELDHPRALPVVYVIQGYTGQIDMWSNRVAFEPTTKVHDIPFLSSIRRLVSINSAVEVDLWGQVNGEAVDGSQISGVGGSLDFIEAARYSEEGLSVIALRSTARGRSRIVPRLALGTPVTIPRFAVDAVVTEHGVARLTGLSLEARAEALIEVASPPLRSELRDGLARADATTRRDP